MLRAGVGKTGIAEGDFVEATFLHGKIVITLKLLIDRSEFPSSSGEYTAARRRTIDSRLNKAAAEIKKGHVSPAFSSIEEFAAAIQADARKLKGKMKRSARR